MADRGEVKIREGKVDDLINLYKKSYTDIVETITTSTEAGKIRKFAVLANINRQLESLGVDVKAWVDSEIPQYYLDGANQAQQDLKAAGYSIDKLSGFATINTEAIKALTDETALSFAESLTAISRSADRLLSTAYKQQINFIVAQGKLTGEARKAVSDNVADFLRSKGLTALKDSSGREWDFDVYARMLVRTKAVEARNQGLQNRMLTSGYDLVQVSDHNSEHPACHKYEGKILSLTGNTPVGTKLPGGYTVFATYQDALAGGLFHPNCRHAINVISPELAATTEAYDNPYNHLSPEERAKADAQVLADRKADRKAARAAASKPAAKGAIRGIMSEAEANAAIVKSKYKETIFHGTDSLSIDQISKNGFELLESKANGKDYGNALYFTADNQLASKYAELSRDYAKSHGSPDATSQFFSLKIDTRNPLVVDGQRDYNLEFMKKVGEYGKEKGILNEHGLYWDSDSDREVLAQYLDEVVFKEHDAVILKNVGMQYFNLSPTTILVKDPSVLKIFKVSDSLPTPKGYY